MVNGSEKHELISRANSSMFGMIAVASALLVFSLVSMSSLYKLAVHRSHVIKEKKTASKTLTANDAEIGKLITAFKAFEGAPESVIGTTEKNSKIVLDALPPEYDFPALATSLEKILTEGGYGIDSIAGKDAGTSKSENSATPEAIEMPFTLTVSGPYDQVRKLPFDLERSIRPMHITDMTLAGSAANARITISAKTYYQPGKSLSLTYKEVK